MEVFCSSETVPMEKIKLKICGMREADNIRSVALLQPDMMGFIFYSKSPRYVGEGFTLPGEFPSSIKRVGVFVNEKSGVILEKAKSVGLDYAQLHGNEPVQQCEALSMNNVKVIKVFSVDDDFDFKLTKNYEPVVDLFLFDTKGKYYGGNAQTFNWKVLDKYNQRIPFLLSGGLSPENVREAIEATKGMNIYALDVNSGVELSAAVKDIEKIRSLKEIIVKNQDFKTKTI